MYQVTTFEGQRSDTFLQKSCFTRRHMFFGITFELCDLKDR